MTVQIRCRARGPLVVELEGPCELYGLDGERIALDGRKRVLLCRCGHSKHAPLCDGAHNASDFERPPSDDVAVDSEEPG